MQRRIKAPLVAAALVLGSLVPLTACNTVKGAGQDVQSAGQTIEQTARESNDGNPNTP